MHNIFDTNLKTIGLLHVNEDSLNVFYKRFFKLGNSIERSQSLGVKQKSHCPNAPG
jgi:hypothetical protein